MPGHRAGPVRADELRFTIGPRGAVSEADIGEDQLGSAALRECVLTRVRAWRLPVHPSSEVPVDYPLVFAPKS